MRIPPFPGGHGGSQRAWLLAGALAALGDVHFVLVHRPGDRDLDGVSLDPLRARMDSVAVLPVPEWESLKARHRWLPWRVARWIDPFAGGPGEAPRLPAAALARIAAALPARRFDLLFAGRLPCAAIVDQLIAAGLVAADRRLVDFDDVMSRFKRRQLDAGGGTRSDRLLQRLDIAQVARAERRIAARWDAVSLCSDCDVADMAATVPAGRIVKVPNVVDRPLLPPDPARPPRLLFVGNLSFPPNEHGLRRFLDEAWPRVRARRPDATLDVVGLRPSDALRTALAARAGEGVALHADAPSVEPHYRRCAAVVCPIFFGGGTRIKLLEAMAYGRPVVATTIGAEGLDVVPGVHALIADAMPDFADAALALLADPARADRLAAAARALQQAAFGPAAIDAAVAAMAGVGAGADAVAR